MVVNYKYGDLFKKIRSISNYPSYLMTENQYHKYRTTPRKIRIDRKFVFGTGIDVWIMRSRHD